MKREVKKTKLITFTQQNSCLRIHLVYSKYIYFDEKLLSSFYYHYNDFWIILLSSYIKQYLGAPHREYSMRSFIIIVYHINKDTLLTLKENKLYIFIIKVKTKIISFQLYSLSVSNYDIITNNDNQSYLSSLIISTTPT